MVQVVLAWVTDHMSNLNVIDASWESSVVFHNECELNMSCESWFCKPIQWLSFYTKCSIFQSYFYKAYKYLEYTDILQNYSSQFGKICVRTNQRKVRDRL